MAVAAVASQVLKSSSLVRRCGYVALIPSPVLTCRVTTRWHGCSATSARASADGDATATATATAGRQQWGEWKTEESGSVTLGDEMRGDLGSLLPWLTAPAPAPSSRPMTHPIIRCAMRKRGLLRDSIHRRGGPRARTLRSARTKRAPRCSTPSCHRLIVSRVRTNERMNGQRIDSNTFS